MLQMLGRISSSVPALFRSSAQELQYSPEVFDSKPTKSGTLVRLTYDMILEMEARRPGFIAKLVDYEVVAPYPTDGSLHDELKRRFGHTNSRRMVFAIMDDKDAPEGHIAEPLSIIYGAVSGRLARTLREIISGIFGNQNGDTASTITCYSAINMAHKDTGRRKELSKGIGARQVEEARKVIKEHFPSIIEMATLSPLIGFDKWLQSEATEADIAALTESLSEAKKPVSLDALRAARAAGGVEMSDPKVLEATKRAIAVFVMRMKQGRDGNPGFVDNAAGLHVPVGADIAEILVDDPADPRVRYYYSMNDRVLAANAKRYEKDGVITVAPEFRKYLSKAMATKVQIAKGTMFRGADYRAAAKTYLGL